LTYNGDKYNSEKNNSDSNGVEGWIIAVAVVGGVIGLILLIVVISCIAKKLKNKK